VGTRLASHQGDCKLTSARSARHCPRMTMPMWRRPTRASPENRAQLIKPSSRLAARTNRVVNVAGKNEIELELTASPRWWYGVRRFLTSDSVHAWNNSRKRVSPFT